MKKSLFTLAVLSLSIAVSQAALINAGFTITNPADPNDPGTLDGPGAFDSYVQGVGAGRPLAGGVATATWLSGPTTAVGGPVDLLGWAPAPTKGNPDTGKNGVGGSSGLNIFASWGGQQRVIGDTTDTVLAGSTYTLTAQIDGASGGPMDGPLVFDLMANGVVLTADASLPSFTATPGTFQTITRTYTNVTLPGGVTDGDPLTVLLGVTDLNTNGNRMIWDDVTLTVIPEPSSALLLGLGGMALALRRPRKK